MLSFSERAPLTEAAAQPHRLGAPGSENESNSPEASLGAPQPPSPRRRTLSNSEAEQS